MIDLHVRLPRHERSLRRFRADVLRGLSGPAKELPCKYFYDDAGSDLFEQITRLDEYYPTRTELAIMQRHAAEMAELAGPRSVLIEYGSGSSTKTRLLLDHLREPAGYVPVDISGRQLRQAARQLAAEYPALNVQPLNADFARSLRLPRSLPRDARRVIYFPGSTIGNFTAAEAIALLKRTANLVGATGALLLGADMQKDQRVLEAAYNDKHGITAAFNRNILLRINRELGADFVPGAFAHRAFYNQVEARIEMHLVSRCQQRVQVAGETFSFAAGESVCTEYSHKYTPAVIRNLATAAGMAVPRAWTDERDYFGVYLLAPEGGREM